MPSISGYIMTLGVIPDLRRQGLASYLLRKLTRRLFRRGADLVELDVITSDPVALNLYLKHQFEMRFINERYYFIQGQHYDSFHLVFERSSLTYWPTAAQDDEVE